MLLAQLGPEWFVRHSVPIGAGTTDVDHLLIGPAGVFALNTKHHSGHSIWVGDHVLRVNTSNTSHLSAAIHEAREVTSRLSRKARIPVEAFAVLVIVGARSIKDIRPEARRQPTVIPAPALVGWLSSLPARLTTSEVGLIRLAAEEPDTWHVDPHAADTLRVMQRFDRLRSAVQPAPATRGSYTSVRRVKTSQTAAAPHPRGSLRRGLIRAAFLVASVTVLLAFSGPIMQLLFKLMVQLLALLNPAFASK